MRHKTSALHDAWHADMPLFQWEQRPLSQDQLDREFPIACAQADHVERDREFPIACASFRCSMRI